jgi:hypothetical protein
MVFQRGTFLLQSGTHAQPNMKHLHIVCSDTCPLGGNLIVPVSTFYDGCDNTCELDVGDHEFIRHLSFVFYANSKVVLAARIDDLVAQNQITLKPDVSGEVFQRVLRGICLSRDTPPKVKKYYGC